VSCTSIAYLVATSCKGKEQPEFPQDSFIWETWNTTYTMFAAYFDLGRNQVWRAADALRKVDMRSNGAKCQGMAEEPPRPVPVNSLRATMN
jgi:hypothetical protein